MLLCAIHHTENHATGNESGGTKSVRTIQSRWLSSYGGFGAFKR